MDAMAEVVGAFLGRKAVGGVAQNVPEGFDSTKGGSS